MVRASAVLWLTFCLFGCAKSHDLGPLPGDEVGQAGGSAQALTCDEQIDAALDGLPEDLGCVGLYDDVASKKVAKSARSYAPANALWSDGADKARWIQLPAGKKIDASEPKDWQFPVGTTFYKEFAAMGRRVETRVFRKDRDDHWVRGTYKWNAKETAATRSQGEDLLSVGLGGNPYHIPTGRECDLCHEGRKDRILGFEAVSLGLPGAKGVTLQDLVDEDLIDSAPEETHYEIGDDGTGKAAEALGWLHINCGASCHNDATDSEAYSSGLRLELDPADLDGRPANELDVMKTTVGVKAKTLRWSTQTRIVPGDPDNSLLYHLVSSRGGGKNDQMPPVATKIIDPMKIGVVHDWIEAMKPQSGTTTTPIDVQ